MSIVGQRQPSRITAVDERTLTHCMEQLHEAYVMGVASTAGCSVTNVRRDMHGVDLELVRPYGPTREEISVKAQLKSTTTVGVPTGRDEFSYQFKKLDYFRYLAMRRKHDKIILIVMAIGVDQRLWTECSLDALTMRHCCYWVSLEGRDIPTAEQPTIRIPTANVFDAGALTRILNKLENDEPLC